MRIPCLRQNLKQFIIWQEIKTWKGSSFDFKIVLHLLLDIFQLFVILLKLPQQLFARTAIVNQRSFVGLHHHVLPKLVNNYELFIFLWQLLLNILSSEDVFKIHPLSLAGEPLVNDLRDEKKSFFNDLDAGSNLSNISGTHHGLNF